MIRFYGTAGILGHPSQRLLEFQFRARRNYLETFLPCIDSRIDSPGGWSNASWVIRRIQPEEWQGRGEVTVLGLCIFNALLAPDEPKEFNPVTFCDNPEFVTAARQEQNLPILLADLNESVIGSKYRMDASGSGVNFMGIGTNLSSGHLNGVFGKESHQKAWASVTPLNSDALEAIFPGMANIIQRLQGLDMHDLAMTRSQM